MNESPNPISPEFRDAFLRAVGCYQNWSQGTREVDVRLDGRDYPFSAVLRFCTEFNDPVPQDLQTKIANRWGFPGRSYGDVASYLLISMRDRKAIYEHVQKNT